MVSIYIAGTQVDLFEDFNYSFNYSSVDIRFPEKRNADFSKTIKLAGTTVNNNLFQHIYEVGIDGGYNANKKQSALVLCDGAEVFRGFARLVSITKIQNKIVYEINITSNTREYFTAMGDTYISDLDLSAYPITRTDTEILTLGTYTRGYDYPLINTGRHDFSQATPTLDADDFLPSIYAYRVMKAIDTLTGFSVTDNSSFLSSSFFKSLVIPSLPAYGAIPNRRATITINYTLKQTSGAPMLIKFKIRRTPHVTGVQVDLYDSGYLTIPNGTSSSSLSATIDFDAGDTIDFSVKDSGWVNYTLTAATNIVIAYQNNGINGANGDVTIKNATDVTYASGGAEHTIQADTVVSGSGAWDIAVWFHKTSSIYLQSYLPDNIKCRDFVISIFRMFNLYMWSDKILANTLYTETRDVTTYSTGYYANNVLDWDNKVDVSKEFKILPMGLLDAKQYEYKYKDDADWFNKYYQEQFGYGYGRHLEIIDNDFMVNSNKSEVIFSATPLRQSSVNNFIIPTIVTDNPALASTNQTINVFKGNIRLLFCRQTKLYDGNASYEWQFTYAGSTTVVDGYIYAGHFDEPLSPTIDLNFDAPEVLYYNFDVTHYPASNVYGDYHSKMINEITDKDSKIIQCYIHLTSHDIQKMDFRYRYFIGGQLYRLNKITDFNPNGTQSTAVELIRINPKNATAPTVHRIDYIDRFN